MPVAKPGRLTVGITPLLQSDSAFTEADVVMVEQFLDARVTVPLNAGRLAEVLLSMDDEIVADLAPFAQALRVYYWRPSEGTKGEPVFWGQCNVIDDYTNGTVKLVAQDPTLRMMHHYLRIGDEALDDPADDQKGTIHPDGRGITTLMEAAEAPSGPVLGLLVNDVASVNTDQLIEVERGQEVQAMIDEVAGMVVGPDYDMAPEFTVEFLNYAQITLYEHLGIDLTATVTFDYGPVTDSEDNLEGVMVEPEIPTTHAHVVDRDRKWRSTGFAPDAVAETGMFVEWVATDFDVKDGDTTVLEEVAKAKIRAYGRPVKQTSIEPRPDGPQAFFFGHPDWPGNGGDTAGDFYLGDRVGVRAQRGYRSLDGEYRITQVELSQPGARGPLKTMLTVIPHAEPITVELDTDET